MLPNAFYATLAQSLAQNGSETEVYLSNITTLTGETVTTSLFSTFGRGVITVDPLVSSSIEFVSFTGVDATGIGFTGAVRGLSALGNSSVTANKKYHPVGSQVIIAFGVHNLLDIKAYVDAAVTGSLGTATDTTAGSTKVDHSMGSKPRARGSLVSEQASPNMTLKVNAFAWAGNNLNIVYAGGNTATLTAPSVNPRIDLVVYDTNASTIAVRAGTEAVSPTAPTPTSGDLLLARIYHRVGETTLLECDVSPNTQGYIQNWYEPTLYLSTAALNSNQVHDATIDQSQGTSNGSITVGEANLTTKHSLVAQKFVAGKSSIKGARLWKIADTGTFTGTVTVALQADSSGSPSGSNLASSTITNAVWLKLAAAAEFEVAFSSEYSSLAVGTSYWLVASCSTGDNLNHPNLGINTAGGYASGALKYNNSADGWVLVATSMLYFKTTEGVTTKLMQTSTDGLPPSEIRPYSLLAIDTTSHSHGGDTTETVICTVQLAGGIFTLNSGLRISTILSSSMGTAAGATSTFKVKLNGTTVVSVTLPTVNNSNNNVNAYAGDLMAIILNNNSLSSQKWIAKALSIISGYNFSSTAIGSPSAVDSSASGTSSVDTSSQPVVLEITVTNTNSNVTGSCGTVIVEKIG